MLKKKHHKKYKNVPHEDSINSQFKQTNHIFFYKFIHSQGLHILKRKLCVYALTKPGQRVHKLAKQAWSLMVDWQKNVNILLLP